MDFLIVLFIAIIGGVFWFLLSKLDLKIPSRSAIIAEEVKIIQSISEREREIEKKKCCAICKYFYEFATTEGKGVCWRFPQEKEVYKKRFCGEFKADEKLYYEKVAQDYCTNPFRSEK